MRKWFKAFQDLIYPPLCIHCSASLYGDEKIFCLTCLELLELAPEDGRCPTCFSADCNGCRKFPIKKMAAAFEHRGPAATLLHHFKERDRSEFALAASGYMVAQLLKLNWPLPHLIVAFPLSSFEHYQTGYNPNEILARAIATLLQVPVLKTNGKMENKIALLIHDTLKLRENLCQCAELLNEKKPSEIYALSLTVL